MSCRSRFVLRVSCLAVLALPAVSGEGAVRRVPDPFPTIGAAEAASADGDTVLVAPGVYARRVATTRPVVILAEAGGEARLAGLDGEAAHVEGFVFDSALTAGAAPLVDAGSGLTLKACRFLGPATGLALRPGAGDVAVLDCAFSGSVQGLALGTPGGPVLVETATLEDCPFGLLAGDTLACGGPSDGAPEVILRDVTVRGGECALRIGRGVRLTLERTTVESASIALEARHAALSVDACSFTGGHGDPVGLRLDSVRGTVTRSRFDALAVACDVGFRPECPEPSEVALGGSLASGNTFLANVVQLRLRQNEPLAADYNHWGSLDCGVVASDMEGQTPGLIADRLFLFAVNCTTPVEPATWGGIKARGGPR